MIISFSCHIIKNNFFLFNKSLIIFFVIQLIQLFKLENILFLLILLINNHVICQFTISLFGLKTG